MLHPSAQPQSTLTIRRSVESDTLAIERLTQLEGRALPPSTLIVAEVDGEIRAALASNTGEVVADPFKPSGKAVEAMRAWAFDPAMVPKSSWHRLRASVGSPRSRRRCESIAHPEPGLCPR